MRIGLDFDNTIIRYDEVFAAAARARGLVEEGFTGSKQAVRDTIRLLPDGELSWQKLQGHVYGRGIAGAEPYPGLAHFLERARNRGDTVLIVSHKTQYGHHDPERVNLREAALGWMTAGGFFAPERHAMVRENVFFEETRAAKLKRLGALDCDVFVDDLEEVLDDPDFPATVRRILFSAAAAAGEHPYPVCRDWAAVEALVFG